MTPNQTEDFNLEAALWDLRDSFTDVNLVCNAGHVLQGHRIILAASSSFFLKTFSLRNRDEVLLPKVDSAVMQNLLEFIYTGQAPKTEQDFLEFVNLGRKLSVHGLPDERPKSRPQDEDVEPGVFPEDASRSKRKFGQKEPVEYCQAGSKPVSGKHHRTQDEPLQQLQLSDLPDEVLLQILSHVPTSDLLLNVSLVSKRFKSLAMDPDAHVSVTFNNLGSNLNEATKFMGGKKKIEEIRLVGFNRRIGDFRSATFEPRTWGSVVLRLRRLKVLDLGYPWQLSSEMLDLVGQDPERVKHLTKIVANMTIDVGFNWTHPTSLRHLDLNGVLTTQHLVKLGQTTKILETLRSTAAVPHQGGIKGIFGSNRGSLKEVDLRYYHLTQGDVQALFQCPNLEILSLNCTRVGPGSLAAFSKLQSLQVLKISLSQQLFAPADVIRFVENLNDLLETFSLRYDGNFDDVIMRSVAKLTHLRDLTLWSKFGSSLVTSQGFYDVYTGCNRLRILNLRMDIDVDDKAGQRINSLTNLNKPDLKYLRPGNGGFLTPLEIRKLLRKSSSLRACLHGNTIFVKEDTTCKEIFDGYDEHDLCQVFIHNVDVS